MATPNSRTKFSQIIQKVAEIEQIKPSEDLIQKKLTPMEPS